MVFSVWRLRAECKQFEYVMTFNEGLVVGITNQAKMIETTIKTVTALAHSPMVRVDREDFLRSQFADSPYLDKILAQGPQSVYGLEELRRMADKVISGSATQTALASFVAGLPANPLIAIPVGGVDVLQYFGFALNMAQRLAYLFGDQELFEDGKTDISEKTRITIIAYLGGMLGVAGSAGLIAKISRQASAVVGKRVAAKVLTMTMWHPAVEKVAMLVGKKITQKTVDDAISKVVPLVGGVISGGLTYATYKPMGARFADLLMKRAKGELA